MFIIKVLLLIFGLPFLFIIGNDDGNKTFYKKIIYDEVHRPHTISTPLIPWYEFYKFQLILIGCQLLLFTVFTIIGWDHLKYFCFGTDDINSTRMKKFAKK
ncbi:Hypothetical protein SRAE_2000119600 [Strongyloides ratti]|uniref:Uncharacterized protein n=1 Tax=Strongyloides ratti TaxID=34506 RepID=A0A090LEF7_STRRB|nr:Hypothetical protein SRAE_2000119600 [Strongyloides ratti]CEF66528.1 Hypothetical protein SRAE_2000119600 [Strongyloides ratti]